MADENKVINDSCDFCGCSAEIGTIITEGDDVFEYELKGGAEKVEEDSGRYDSVARSVSEAVQIHHHDTRDGEELTRRVSLKFTCTAEKMIFQIVFQQW